MRIPVPGKGGFFLFEVCLFHCKAQGSLLNQLYYFNTMSNSPAYSFAEKLCYRFCKQSSFCLEYSPLYASIFGCIGRWLQKQTDCGQWLIRAAQSRTPFETPMLIASGLHYLVLEGRCTDGLASFFPTVGGLKLPTEEVLDVMLIETVQENREFLEQWIATVSVQTNETGRGLGWVLPLLYTPWKSVVIVDLGASAGLNLVAEKRSYLLESDMADTSAVKVGTADSEQFIFTCHGCWTPPQRTTFPAVSARIGCDRFPLPVNDLHDERLLCSFVWGDQPQRMLRLQEGIAAFRECCMEKGQIPIYRIELPGELAVFLKTIQDEEVADPMVLFSSYITTYLHDKGKSLFEIIQQWATGQQRAIVWFQQDLAAPDIVACKPPDLGWVLWSANVWQAATHISFHLAWCHPHGTQIQWLPGIRQWQKYWQ
ncbi:DUF2332 family protein [Desulfogranum japonicum]|uniref:DUF2332 family protein n=1 Tax=Desulfogranum japonicum TaxID=231447 RepID=UPI000402C797|nr:DUF2332 family protein [Desulfogranum japonicum]